MYDTEQPCYSYSYAYVGRDFDKMTVPSSQLVITWPSENNKAASWKIYYPAKLNRFALPVGWDKYAGRAACDAGACGRNTATPHTYLTWNGYKRLVGKCTLGEYFVWFIRENMVTVGSYCMTERLKRSSSDIFQKPNCTNDSDFRSCLFHNYLLTR